MAIEHTLTKFKHIQLKKESMDLVTAKARAIKASETAKRPYYVIVEEDGECSVNTAPLRGSMLKFVNGKHDTSYKPNPDEKVAKKKNEIEEIIEVEPFNKTNMKTTKKNSKKEVKSTAKSAPAKESAPTKGAAKKPAAAKGAAPEGENKKLTVETIIKIQKTGKRVYRNVEPFYILIPERVAKMKDKKKVLDVIVRKD